MTRDERDDLLDKLTVTVSWRGMSDEERRTARACASVFLDSLADLGMQLVPADRTDLT